MKNKVFEDILDIGINLGNDEIILYCLIAENYPDKRIVKVLDALIDLWIEYNKLSTYYITKTALGLEYDKD